MSIKVTLKKPLCSPEYNLQTGATTELPDKLAKALIDAGAAIKFADPASAKKAQAAAVTTAKKAIDSTLKADIAAVKSQLKTDKVKPGAKHDELDVAADAVIEELRLHANEAKESL